MSRIPVAAITIAVAILSGNPCRICIADEPIDFAHEIVPILRKHCAECHAGTEAEGGFSLNTRELLTESGHVLPGDADGSNLLELVTSDDPDERMPPDDRPPLPADDVRLLHQWISDGVAWEAGFSFAPDAYEPPLTPRRPELPPPVDGRDNPIDRILDAYAREHDLPRPEPISDEAFLRRASLDLVGLLPDPETLARFRSSSDPQKRARLVRRLLDDKFAYADHWLTFFNDLLRNDYTGTGFITGGRFQISGWLYDALLENKPFNEFARELIAPQTPESRGYIEGIQWRGSVSAAQKVQLQFAQSVSQSFLGINLKCASCHDSFIDRWTLDQAYGLAAIYAEEPLDIHRCDKPTGRQAKPAWLFPELGSVDGSATREQRLKQLAALMTHPQNGRFPRTIVNRVWHRLMGRGIVHPLDAMQSQPWNDDLLDYLAVSLADHHYDLKAILELIATSQAYQSQCEVSADEPPDGSFAQLAPLPKRLTAEQFVDTIWQLTGEAPAAHDAPVIRGDASPNVVASLALEGKWISCTADDDPDPDLKSILLRKNLKIEGSVLRGAAVVACDAPFSLYVNGQLVLRGSGSRELFARELRTDLANKAMNVFNKGRDAFAVVITLDNSATNPQMYFEARLKLESGEELRIASDATWECARDNPELREGLLVGNSAELSAALENGAFDPSEAGSAAQDILARSVSENVPMVRASLMKNDPLMKSLGRPGRDQIVAMRPQELSTLEAINLSNGPELATALTQGANRLRTQFANRPGELINHVYRFALSRDATNSEQKFLVDYLGSEPTAEVVADFLWTICLSPEFMFVR